MTCIWAHKFQLSSSIFLVCTWVTVRFDDETNKGRSIYNIWINSRHKDTSHFSFIHAAQNLSHKKNLNNLLQDNFEAFELEIKIIKIYSIFNIFTLSDFHSKSFHTITIMSNMFILLLHYHHIIIFMSFITLISFERQICA